MSLPSAALSQRGVHAVAIVVGQCPPIKSHSGPAGAEYVHDVHQDIRCSNGMPIVILLTHNSKILRGNIPRNQERPQGQERMSQVIALDAHRQARKSEASKAEKIVAGNQPAYELLSALPGRVRCKVPVLYRSAAFKQRIEDRLAGHDRIVAVSANVLTGSVLILFDRGHDPAAITALLFAVLEEVAASTDPVRSEAPAAAPSHPLRARLRQLIPHRQAQDVQPWHRLEADEVLAALGGTRSGLASAQVQERLKQYGPNLLPEATLRSELGMFLGQFRSLPVALLGASAVVSVLTGGLADALVILAVVMVNATLGYITESQAERTIKSLTGPAQPHASPYGTGFCRPCRPRSWWRAICWCSRLATPSRPTRACSRRGA